MQRETGQGQAHHHAPVRDYLADASDAERTGGSLEHWKCLGVGCAVQWVLRPGEKPRV